ncbi:MAG: uroporphyrinogen-III synthase, partial [Acidimicrobiales bacterium]
ATVVRLKGGDPFVFGRGGEEALALAGAGVAFEVVPGITSAVAVPAYAGVPVTHRGLSTSFTVVTGHRRSTDEAGTNWEALAAVGGTIVVLMGVAHRAEIARRLMAGGLTADTPVVAVHWGTRPEQVSAHTTLGALGALALAPPATFVVGAVAGLDVGWYEGLPLFGRRVVVTRARAQAPALSAPLRELGARPVEVPVIEIVAPADGGAGLRAAAAGLAEGRFTWVVFTSANAVAPLVDALADARSFAGARIAAIGPGTAGALARYRLVPDLVPERAVGEGLVEAFPPAPGAGPAGPGGGEGDRVLLVRAATGRDVLPAGLSARGWDVDVVEAYRTVPARPGPALLAAAEGADAVCFTSSSTVTGLVEALGRAGVPPVVACIGPVTAATAREAGLQVTAVAREHTIAGLVEALCAALAAAPKGRCVH